MGHFVKDLTYEQLQPLLHEDAVVVLPVGTAAKEHGYHLPMGTDFFVTGWIAEQITEREPVLTLETIPFGYFPAFAHWAGSVHIESCHFIDYVADVLKSYIRFGIKKFLILDGGVSTHPPLCVMARDLQNEYGVFVAVTDITKLAVEAEEQLCTQKRGGHGDESETSTMLYLREDLVHMDKAVEEYNPVFPGTTVNGIKRVDLSLAMRTKHGINGNSTLATKEKGEKILAAMLESICYFLKQFVEYR